MNHSHLEVGDQAPPFVVTDALGETAQLSDYKDSPVLLVFLRYSGCPLCNLTIHRLTMEYPMLLKSGCKVIAFVQSTAEDIKTNIYGRHKNVPQFPIIPDPDRKFYDMYGVQNSAKILTKVITDVPYWMKSIFELGFKQTKIDGDLLLVPATFLIGPDEQRLELAEYNASFYEHNTFTSIYESLTFK